jgi:hypothetical protein
MSGHTAKEDSATSPCCGVCFAFAYQWKLCLQGLVQFVITIARVNVQIILLCAGPVAIWLWHTMSVLNYCAVCACCRRPSLVSDRNVDRTDGGRGELACIVGWAGWDLLGGVWHTVRQRQALGKRGLAKP